MSVDQPDPGDVVQGFTDAARTAMNAQGFERHYRVVATRLVNGTALTTVCPNPAGTSAHTLFATIQAQHPDIRLVEINGDLCDDPHGHPMDFAGRVQTFAFRWDGDR